MSLILNSPCKVNLLLNILKRRPDGFHELETLFQPVPFHDVLHFEAGESGVQLSCSKPELPTDHTNLVHRAATAFLQAIGTREGARIHLEKRLPIAAGLGAGSANAAVTLKGLNSVFNHPLSEVDLNQIASTLGSDVPFFLQDGPAIGTGRGECITPIQSFSCLKGTAVLLIRPDFGISTAWAYSALQKHPEALNGRQGCALKLVRILEQGNLKGAQSFMFNSLEVPVFHKYPILALLKEFLLENGAEMALMSGSGSTSFAVAPTLGAAELLRSKVIERFGHTNWTAVAEL